MQAYISCTCFHLDQSFQMIFHLNSVILVSSSWHHSCRSLRLKLTDDLQTLLRDPDPFINHALRQSQTLSIFPPPISLLLATPSPIDRSVHAVPTIRGRRGCYLQGIIGVGFDAFHDAAHQLGKGVAFAVAQEGEGISVN